MTSCSPCLSVIIPVYDEEHTIARVIDLAQARVQQVINLDDASYDEGKKINWKDGLRALWCILKHRFAK